jgi:DNA (cytosine-5)-methyltransferase 1
LTRNFYEFFAGGGMARLGLGNGWTCLAANDFDRAKCAAYRENFGGDHLIERDIAQLSPAELPGRADLAWASFPCQDLSLAGQRRGMSGGRSGTFWAFWFLIEQLLRDGRPPRALVIENVVGLATSHGGADFAALCGALAGAGYHFDAQVVDAADFLPQSRPRLFILGWRGETPPGMLGADQRPPALTRAFAALPEETAAMRQTLDWPRPAPHNLMLADIVEDAPKDVKWKTRREVRALFAMMAPLHRARVEMALAEARLTGADRVAGVYRRMRPDRNGGTVQRAEVRFDIAGCLRTPAGGSSRQTLLFATPEGEVRARLLSAREAARLMGLPEEYRLPTRYNAAYKLAGDGVAAPVARWIGERMVAPMLDGR